MYRHVLSIFCNYIYEGRGVSTKALELNLRGSNYFALGRIYCDKTLQGIKKCNEFERQEM